MTKKKKRLQEAKSGTLTPEQILLLDLIHHHPGKTVTELSKLSRLPGGEVWLQLEPLFSNYVERRREPDMRVKGILANPAKYAAARLTGKNLTATAWRFYV